MRRPCLSVTVNTTLTSFVPVRRVGTFSSSVPSEAFCSGAAGCVCVPAALAGLVDAVSPGDCAPALATANVPRKHANARMYFFPKIFTVSPYYSRPTRSRFMSSASWRAFRAYPEILANRQAAGSSVQFSHPFEDAPVPTQPRAESFAEERLYPDSRTCHVPGGTSTREPRRTTYRPPRDVQAN